MMELLIKAKDILVEYSGRDVLDIDGNCEAEKSGGEETLKIAQAPSGEGARNFCR